MPVPIWASDTYGADVQKALPFLAALSCCHAVLPPVFAFAVLSAHSLRPICLGLYRSLPGQWLRLLLHR